MKLFLDLMSEIEHNKSRKLEYLLHEIEVNAQDIKYI